MPPRDAEATKERILSAAFDEFSSHGFAGARVDEIATRAGCNKALLYQYYGDKERLFTHVLECKMGELWRLEADPAHLAEVAAMFFDLHAANPSLARLIQYEALNFGNRAVPNEPERTEHMRRHVDQIAKAQEAGTVDPALDPAQTLVSLIGMISVWFTAPQAARMVTGEDPRSPEALQRRREHVIEMARRMLEVKS